MTALPHQNHNFLFFNFLERVYTFLSLWIKVEEGHQYFKRDRQIILSAVTLYQLTILSGLDSKILEITELDCVCLKCTILPC